ncbi:MAG: hypothetical protein WCK67_11120 [bacterium]
MLEFGDKVFNEEKKEEVIVLDVYELPASMFKRVVVVNNKCQMYITDYGDLSSI